VNGRRKPRQAVFCFLEPAHPCRHRRCSWRRTKGPTSKAHGPANRAAASWTANFLGPALSSAVQAAAKPGHGSSVFGIGTAFSTAAINNFRRLTVLDNSVNTSLPWVISIIRPDLDTKQQRDNLRATAATRPPSPWPWPLPPQMRRWRSCARTPYLMASQTSTMRFKNGGNG